MAAPALNFIQPAFPRARSPCRKLLFLA